jgi:hypothetical protein
MNSSLISKAFFGGLVALSLGLTSCAQKEGTAVRVPGRGGLINGDVNFISNGSGTPNGIPQNTSTCSDNQTGNGSLQFDVNAVLGLVTATIGQDSFKGICKVNFSARFIFDANGILNPTGSGILLQVIDSYVGMVVNGRTIPPYELNFQNAKGGSYDRSTGKINVQFEDSFGSLTVVGQDNGQMVTGAIYFQNYKNIVTTQQPAQGTLGSFSIPRAVLMN